jgi:hypothetical protein
VGHRTANGWPYVKATTADPRGTHKLLFSCGGPQRPPVITALFWAGSEAERVILATSFYQFDFAPGGEIDLSRGELMERVAFASNGSTSTL